MPFSDFNKLEPVLTATDYNNIKIHPGDGAYTDTFNRSIIDSINRDMALEEAATYIARSSKLYLTNNTTTFIPCDEDATDVVGNSSYTMSVDSYKDAFIYDDYFKGAVYAQSPSYNILKNTSIDSNFKSNSGWTIGFDASKGISVTTSTTNSLTITNNSAVVNKKSGGSTVSIVSSNINVSSIASSAANVLSAGVRVHTSNNMSLSGATVKLALESYNSSNKKINEDTCILSNKNSFSGSIYVNNFTLGSSCTYVKVRLTITYTNIGSLCNFSISNLMLQNSSVCGPYTSGTNNGVSIKYDNIIDFTKVIDKTVSCWCKITDYALSSTTKGFGPLFINYGNISIGSLIQNVGSKVYFCSYLRNGSTKTYGEKIELTPDNINVYRFVGTRIKQCDELDLYGNSYSTYIIIESFIICGKDIIISSIPINKSILIASLPTNATLVLGLDAYSNTTNTNYFNGPITQIRVDSEWLSDIDAYILSLSNRCIDYGSGSSGSYLYGINLLNNPTAKSCMDYWSVWQSSDNKTWTKYTDPLNSNIYASNANSTCITVFDIEYDNAIGGSTFICNGVTTLHEMLVSDFINVNPGEKYVFKLSAKNMYIDTLQNISVKIIWYLNNSNTSGDSVTNDISTNNLLKDFEFIANSPVNATRARVAIYVAPGTYSKLMFKNLKFEIGESTSFSDDSGFTTAYKTVYRVTNEDLIDIFGFDVDTSGEPYVFDKTWGGAIINTWDDVYNRTWSEYVE